MHLGGLDLRVPAPRRLRLSRPRLLTGKYLDTPTPRLYWLCFDDMSDLAQMQGAARYFKEGESPSAAPRDGIRPITTFFVVNDHPLTEEERFPETRLRLQRGAPSC
jgi:hypothetical protein